MQFIETLEETLGKKAIKKMMDMRAGMLKKLQQILLNLIDGSNLNLTPPLKKALSDLLTGIKSTTKLFLFRSFMCFMSFFISLSFS
jgi:Cu/Ag efflux pump CusA